MDLKKKGLNIFSLLKETFQEWNSDDPFRHSAVIAYYAIFSLPALLIIIVNAAGKIFGKEAIEGEIQGQIGSMIGQDAASQVQDMIASASQMDNSAIAIVIGVATLLFGATGVFVQLQQSLNKVWEVEANPDAGLKKLAIDRATSLGVILAIGFLLLISLVISAALAILNGWLQRILPEFMLVLIHIINLVVSIGIITVLFALIYKVLPDVVMKWRFVWLGALVTAILFTIGKFALGFYFGKAEPGSTYGAAGSVILIMLWVNYSALIMLFGAEFTQVYARRKGERIEPSSHARRSAEYRLKEMQREKEENSQQKEKA